MYDKETIKAVTDVPPIIEFPGMNNAAQHALIPIILNMDVTANKKLTVRPGFEQWLALPGAHSVFSDGIDLFCPATGSATPESIYKINVSDASKSEVSSITGKGHPISYVKTKERLFMSSKAWCGVYTYSTEVIGSWGTTYSDDPADIDDMYHSEELLTLSVIPAPKMESIMLWGGRIWGAVGKKVYFNDPPMAFEMFRSDTFLEFTEDIVAVAGCFEGMYFMSEDNTWFGLGIDPYKMVLDRVGDGALQGSLQYIKNSQKFGKNIPIWTSKNGIVVGTGGIPIPLTKGIVKFYGAGMAAALASLKNGVNQYLCSMPLPDTDVGSFSDSATVQVFRDGALL